MHVEEHSMTMTLMFIVLFSVDSLRLQQGGNSMEERIFDDRLEKDNCNSAYAKSKYCKYCGDRLVKDNLYCSDYYLKRDSSGIKYNIREI